MKQKLAIARGMLTNPKILILDEPTRTLDPTSTYSIRKFIKDVIVHQEKKTVIIATNNMQEAEELCDRVAILDRGRVKICGSPSNIKSMRGRKGQYIFQIRGTYEEVKRKLNSCAIDATSIGIVSDYSNNSHVTLNVKMTNGKNELSNILKFLIMSGMDIEAFYPEEYTLNEVFAKLVTQNTDLQP
jgi:ABC-2 type transport system ATP-binding protein